MKKKMLKKDIEEILFNQLKHYPGFQTALKYKFFNDYEDDYRFIKVMKDKSLNEVFIDDLIYEVIKYHAVDNEEVKYLNELYKDKGFDGILNSGSFIDTLNDYCAKHNIYERDDYPFYDKIQLSPMLQDYFYVKQFKDNDFLYYDKKKGVIKGKERTR